jgi:hypothetical protein
LEENLKKKGAGGSMKDMKKKLLATSSHASLYEAIANQLYLDIKNDQDLSKLSRELKTLYLLCINQAQKEKNFKHYMLTVKDQLQTKLGLAEKWTEEHIKDLKKDKKTFDDQLNLLAADLSIEDFQPLEHVTENAIQYPVNWTLKNHAKDIINILIVNSDSNDHNEAINKKISEEKENTLVKNFLNTPVGKTFVTSWQNKNR